MLTERASGNIIIYPSDVEELSWGKRVKNTMR